MHRIRIGTYTVEIESVTRREKSAGGKKSNQTGKTKKKNLLASVLIHCFFFPALHFTIYCMYNSVVFFFSPPNPPFHCLIFCHSVQLQRVGLDVENFFQPLYVCMYVCVYVSLCIATLSFHFGYEGF